jgi:hypothetical protein
MFTFDKKAFSEDGASSSMEQLCFVTDNDCNVSP